MWLRWETYTLNVVFVEHHTHFYVYVSQRSQIQFKDEDHAISKYEFSLSNYYMSSLRTTTCDALIVHSVNFYKNVLEPYGFNTWVSHTE